MGKIFIFKGSESALELDDDDDCTILHETTEL